VEKADVSVASTVVGEADHYFDPVTGEKRRIDLQPYISSGKLAVEQGDAVEMTRIQSTCRRHLELHIGEVESIAVVAANGVKFCTAERAATKALVLLDLGHLAVSFEELLRRHGTAPKSKLKPHFLKSSMAKWLKEGGILKTQTFSEKP